MSQEFIDEVNQKMKEDKAALFWKKYGRLIILGAVVLITGSGAFTGYKSYITSKAQKEALVFEGAAVTADSLKTLITDGVEGTKITAVFKLADALKKEKKISEAVAVLKQYAATQTEGIYKDYAVLYSVWLNMNTAQDADLLADLSAIENNVNIKPLVYLTQANILLKSNKIKQAREKLEKILKLDTISVQETETIKSVISAL